MDLVTVTDHDSIGAAEMLGGHPGFFLSEEVTCRLPSGTELHAGVFGINERHHFQIQCRRYDIPALAAYCREQRLLLSVMHPFSHVTGRREAEDYDCIAALFPAVETLNAQMLRRNNELAAEFSLDHAKVAIVGGSDSHTLPTLGSAYTEVPGAHDAAEFLDGVRIGAARVYGAHGSYGRLTREVLLLARLMMRENPKLLPLAILVPSLPFFTFANYLLERRFAGAWTAREHAAHRRLSPDAPSASLARAALAPDMDAGRSLRR